MLAEFEQAYKEIKEDPARMSVWAPVLAKYKPGMMKQASLAVEWSNEILKSSMKRNMLKDDPDLAKHLRKIMHIFAVQTTTKNHARHIDMQKAKDAGVNIVALEDDQELQDLVLSLHHVMNITFNVSGLVKVISSGKDKTWQIAAHG